MSTSDDVLRDPNHEISKFGEKVFSYCLQKFRLIHKDYSHSSLFTEEIGNAVVIIQLHIRDFLRDHLYRAMEKMVGVIDSNQRLQAIRQLLEFCSDQPLEKYPIHMLFLGYLAVITEMVIFMDSAGLPVRRDWFKQIWTFVYDTKLKQKFEGRWEDLKEEAKKVCDECPQMDALFEELKSLEHPYAEIDPQIETSIKELDPSFIFSTLTTGYDFPRKAGLSIEAMDKLVRDVAVDI